MNYNTLRIILALCYQLNISFKLPKTKQRDKTNHLNKIKNCLENNNSKIYHFNVFI